MKPSEERKKINIQRLSNMFYYRDDYRRASKFKHTQNIFQKGMIELFIVYTCYIKLCVCISYNICIILNKLGKINMNLNEYKMKLLNFDVYI